MNNTKDKEEISHEFSNIMIIIGGPIGGSGRSSLLSAMVNIVQLCELDCLLFRFNAKILNCVQAPMFVVS